MATGMVYVMRVGYAAQEVDYQFIRADERGEVKHRARGRTVGATTP
jgi:hypothetical protein